MQNVHCIKYGTYIKKHKSTYKQIKIYLKTLADSIIIQFQ